VDELDKGLQISLEGDARQAPLDDFRAQLTAWNVAMPPVEPLVLDFGLGDFRATGLIEYWIANEVEAGYCGKYLFVFDGQTCPEHSHIGKHETFFIVEGSVRMALGDELRTMNKGDVLVVPPTHPHYFTGMGPALLLELSSPCKIDDNTFANSRIPFGSNFRPSDEG